MSIQFRSRIKPALNYSNVLNSYGYCCNPTNPSSPTRKSFLECFNEGGYFITSSDDQIPSCPDPQTELGCCCSCSYVTSGDFPQIPTYDSTSNSQYLSSGIQSLVSKCTCARLGGKWTPGNCPDSLSLSNLGTYCIQNNKDVRTPKSCCHLLFDENTGWPTGVQCTDVCTSFDCALLSTEAYPSVFGGETSEQETRCNIPLVAGGPIAECGGTTVIPRMASVSAGLEVGSCFELQETGNGYTYDCRLSVNSDCTGYWVEKQNTETNLFCDISKQPKAPVKVNGFYDVQRMSLSDFNALGLTAGDRFQGGIYLGIFKTPYSGKSSEVLGNISFGTPSVSKFITNDVGSRTNTQWALISQEFMYYVPFLISTEQNLTFETSSYDGYYNTYGDNNTFGGIQTSLTNTIRYVPKNGFIDYYIPSIYELNFYAAYLQRKGLSDRGILISSTLFNPKYIGSSLNTVEIEGSSFVYSQFISSVQNINYRNVLSNTYTIQNMLLFRRIVLS